MSEPVELQLEHLEVDKLLESLSNFIKDNSVQMGDLQDSSLLGLLQQCVVDPQWSSEELLLNSNMWNSQEDMNEGLAFVTAFACTVEVLMRLKQSFGVVQSPEGGVTVIKIDKFVPGPVSMPETYADIPLWGSPGSPKAEKPDEED